MGYVVVGCQLLIGLVFLVASVSKLRSGRAFAEFNDVLLEVRALTPAWVRPVALSLTLSELAVAALLIVPFITGLPEGARWHLAAGGGFAIAVALLIAFTAYIFTALRREVRASCRCFALSSAPLGVPHMVRNGLLAAAALTGLLAPRSPDALDPAGLVVTATVSVVLAVLVMVFDEIVSLFAPAGLAARGVPPTN
ncbi:MauE/DoxX family redox-associated membrane protein [Nonomuraea sp. B19D2]|uniref:MauE/DoxX family redox-associated membrane protein n=1 Tax=Nonomuraea sp. B19D2 TaxID=3159561 RepID=UPI0032DB1102